MLFAADKCTVAVVVSLFVEFKTWSYHEQIGTGWRTVGRQGRAGQDGNPTGLPINETSVNFKPVESKTRTYHGRVGSERPAERPGGVGQDWVPTEVLAQETKVYHTLQKIEEMSLQRLLEARTSEILCKPTEEQNQRLTRGGQPVHPRFITGLSAVYQRDEKRSFLLAAGQWTDACLSL